MNASRLRFKAFGLAPLDFQEESKAEINFEQDDDDEDDESTAAQCQESERLRRLILSKPSEVIASEDFVAIARSQRLREVYHYRDWYRDQDPDNCLVFANTSDKPILAGEQIHFSYGRRTNAYLLLK